MRPQNKMADPEHASSGILVPILLHAQIQETAASCDMLIQQGAVLGMSRKRRLWEEEETSEEESGPGKGHTRNSKKAKYARRPASNVYRDIRDIDPDVTLFEKTTHLSRDEFDALHTLALPYLLRPMDVRNEYDTGSVRSARRRRLSTDELLFFFFDIMGGSNEGSVGTERIAHRYGISVGTVSNYFRHSLFSVYEALDAIEPRLVSWPGAEKRATAEGLIMGFPKCVFFVDGNKARRWRPGENSEQERAYDGYKKTHVWSILVFCDLFGAFTRIEISDKGAESDRNFYTNSEVYKSTESFLSAGQHGMADMGFGGDGALVVPYKRNESTEWLFRTTHNRYIRSQRMVNEWGIGYINNRYRVFLGKWSFEKDLFPIAYTTVAMLSNWQFRRRGYALQPRWRYEEKLAAHEDRDESE